ncbi:MAG: gluzincin family metallopeptidase, partial [Solirubrobacteraceae bacterium]
MASTSSPPEQSDDPTLQATAWDLGPLVGGEGEQGVRKRLSAALERARAFAERYAGKLNELDSASLAAAMRELADLQELVGRGGYYAALGFSTDTAEPANGALLQWVQEQETAIQTTLLFFELEWAALPEERIETLLRGEGLEFCAHHLRNVRRYREHLLSEPEERILTEKTLTGSSAWTRLFEELTSVIEVDLPSEAEGGPGGARAERVPLEVALSRLSLADREVRRTSAEAVTAALAPGLRTRAFLFNTLLADKATDDRLRSYPHWLAARNLANEASDESVQALIDAVRGRFEIPRRWYRLKARLLGLDKLADYDRMATVTEVEVAFPFSQAREIVLDCYSSFSPELGAVAKRFFDERRIDAPLR